MVQPMKTKIRTLIRPSFVDNEEDEEHKDCAMRMIRVVVNTSVVCSSQIYISHKQLCLKLHCFQVSNALGTKHIRTFKLSNLRLHRIWKFSS